MKLKLFACWKILTSKIFCVSVSKNTNGLLERKRFYKNAMATLRENQRKTEVQIQNLYKEIRDTNK